MWNDVIGAGMRLWISLRSIISGLWGMCVGAGFRSGSAGSVGGGMFALKSKMKPRRYVLRRPPRTYKGRPYLTRAEACKRVYLRNRLWRAE